MMTPIKFECVIPLPVAMLDLRKKKSNRISRRRNRYGKQDVWSKLKGELSPKEMRESGL